MPDPLLSKVIRSLLPRGLAWRLANWGQKLIDGLSAPFGRVHEFLRGVLKESDPSTAEDTIPEWYAMLGLPYDPTLQLKTHHLRLSTTNAAIGGQSLQYVQAQINKELPNITLREIRFNFDSMCGRAICGKALCDQNASTNGTTYTPHKYYIDGTVKSANELSRLQALVARIAPLHKDPIYNVSNLAAQNYAVCGLAVCGAAETGKEV